jgi:hypothetical protein
VGELQVMLVELLKLGGLAALAMGVMFLLYRQMMQMGVFRRMTQGQTFALLMTLSILVFIVVLVVATQTNLVNLSTLFKFQSVNIGNGNAGIITNQS